MRTVRNALKPILSLGELPAVNFSAKNLGEKNDELMTVVDSDDHINGICLQKVQIE